MKQNIENKMISPNREKKIKNKYFFPDQQISVEAKTRKEAEEKVNIILKK